MQRPYEVLWLTTENPKEPSVKIRAICIICVPFTLWLRRYIISALKHSAQCAARRVTRRVLRIIHFSPITFDAPLHKTYNTPQLNHKGVFHLLCRTSC